MLVALEATPVYLDKSSLLLPLGVRLARLEAQSMI